MLSTSYYLHDIIYTKHLLFRYSSSTNLTDVNLQMFRSDGFDYFTEMMPALHNYVTVDTEGFLSSEARVGAIFDMCETIMTHVS